MQVIKIQTKMGPLTFKKVNDTRFVVRCKGRNPIKLKQTTTGVWEGRAKCFNTYGVETIAVGKTAQQCYKNSLKSFWM